MMSYRKVYKKRDIEGLLRDTGFVELRTNGGHTIWRHPSGIQIVFPGSHSHPELSDGVVFKIHRQIKMAQRAGTGAASWVK